MILETTEQDYATLIAGRAPRDLRLADTPIASSDILDMLDDVAAEVRETFSPASWLIVSDGELVGLCSVTRPPQNGVVDIGYGIAADRGRWRIAFARYHRTREFAGQRQRPVFGSVTFTRGF